MTGFYEEAIEAATNAANEAGVRWVLEHLEARGEGLILKVTETNAYITDAAGNRVNPMLDLCGGASIQLKGKRSGIYKWLKKTEPERQHYSLHIDHKFGGWQDMGLKVEVIRAAYNVLREQYGIDGITYASYID
jgi:hypothetical protein